MLSEEEKILISILNKEIEEKNKDIKKLNDLLMLREDYIYKDKIRDYFAHDLAFKRRLIRENEEISDYNRGKFDTIEDLLERLEDNK